MKYKVGDKVRVRRDLKNGEYYGVKYFSSDMRRYKGKEITISKEYDRYYRARDNIYFWTDEMFEPVEEFSAEDAIKLLSDICDRLGCNGCPINKSKGDIGCVVYRKNHPDKVVEVLKQWKVDREKKPIETQFMNIVRVIEDTGTMKKCVYEERLPEGELNLSDKQSEVLKKYCEEHKGKYFAVVERICAVKEKEYERS